MLKPAVPKPTASSRRRVRPDWENSRQVAAKAGQVKSPDNFQAYGVANPGEIDPRERTITALVDEVQSLRARLNDMEDRLASTTIHDDAGKSATRSPRRKG